MTPRIEVLSEKKLIGKHMTMSLTQNKTGELWKTFIPRIGEITNRITDDLISLQVYKPAYFFEFNPSNEFEKWASVEVSNFDNVPYDLESFTLKGGLYAVFNYKGSSLDNHIFQFIFETWLPGSDYYLDNRPHFEVLGKKYKNNDPSSEEDIWIPIQPKSTLKNTKK